MKKFLYGGIAGYLLTSIFSIPALPMAFWYSLGVLGVIALVLWIGWRRFDNDMHEGDW